MNIQVWFELFLILTATALFAAWIRARDKARDYGTDLRTLIVQKDLDSRDLRRSLRHKEIREKVEQNYDVDGDNE